MKALILSVILLSCAASFVTDVSAQVVIFPVFLVSCILFLASPVLFNSSKK